MRRGIVISLALSFLLGCSAARMPIEKYVNNPPSSIGATREEIEDILGSPDSSVTNSDGTKTDVYDFREGGMAPSHRVTLGIVSVGISEIVGLFVGTRISGAERQFTVTYDPTDRVIAAVASEDWQQCYDRENRAGSDDPRKACKHLEVHYLPSDGSWGLGGLGRFSIAP